jgi:hypothetical protein
MKTALSVRSRRHAISTILDTRFSLSAFEQVRRENPAFWRSARNDTARGVYGEAMRAKQQLAGASDDELEAELLEIALRRPGS